MMGWFKSWVTCVSYVGLVWFGEEQGVDVGEAEFIASPGPHPGQFPGKELDKWYSISGYWLFGKFEVRNCDPSGT
jgi:hypothetical protein